MTFSYLLDNVKEIKNIFVACPKFVQLGHAKVNSEQAYDCSLNVVLGKLYSL